MKKVLSIVLTVMILLSTLATVGMVSANIADVKTTVIDLTQDVASLFATTGSTTNTTATVEDGKLKVHVSAYERQLSSITSYSNQTWFPTYLLALNGEFIKLGNGSKAIVEVKYKVTGTPNATHGTQIGIGNFNGGKGSNIYLRTSQKHTAADQGKEFTLTSTFVADNKYATKIAFSGGGDIEISSIVIHELSAAAINDYAVVKYVCDGDATTKFAKKNTAPELPAFDGRHFDGWFSNSDYSGEPVSAVTADTTLYGRYTFKTTEIDLTQNAANLFATTGSTTNTTATVEDGKLKVHVSAYERQLSSITSYSNQTWFPNYLLAVNGEFIKLGNGNKAIVEVKYKVTGTPNATHGTQIGIGNFNGGNGSNIYLRTSKKHTAADQGKEFTLTSTFVADNKYATKIAFSGGGDIEISSIVIHELTAEYINDYAVVKYVDGNNEATVFSKKNSAPKAPNLDNDEFAGWYENSDFSGEVVAKITGDITLYGKRKIKTTKIDLTQDVANLFATTGSTTNTTATVEGGKLKVHVSAYERQLSSITSYSNQTWFPNYLLATDGNFIRLGNGNKAIVEVKYKVTGTPNATHGTQIGIGNFNGGKGNNIYLRTSKKHTAADQGKEFTLTSTFVADNKYATKIAFSGGGDIEISSIVIHELAANYIDEYAVVKYVYGNDENTVFAKKNTAPKAPAGNTEEFAGWYANADFSGEAVTAITADITLYGQCKVTTTKIDLTQDVANLFATTGSTTNTTATVEDGKLKVHVSAYERQLSSITSYSNQTWFPNYLLATDGNFIRLGNGNKAIVEVKYKVTGTPNATHGTQIGIGNFNGGKGNNIYLRTSQKHTAADQGKEFTLTSTFVADNKYATKIAFSGGGDIEISSIVIHELAAAYIDEYAVVKYVYNGDETTEFAKKNTTPKAPVNDDGEFAGWYESGDFAGSEAVTITKDVTLYGKRKVTTTKIDLTQDVANIFATTGSTTNTTATVEGGKLKVHVSAYERQLSSITSYSNQTWFPNYLLAVNGEFIRLGNGNKAIVEVKYKVTGTPNETHGTQIGIGNFNGGKGSNIYLRTSKKHTAADQGKEFTLTSTFVADNKYATKIAFSGGGDIEISSIVIHELAAAYIDEYAVVKFVDENEENTEFVKKNTSLKTPVKEHMEFDGWYASEDLSGAAVTSVNGDTTLYAKWILAEGSVVIRFHDGSSTVSKKYAKDDAIDITPVKEGYKFLGWYKYTNYVGRPVTTALEGISDLYAKWEETNPTVETAVDISKNTTMVTTGKTADSKVEYNDNKLVFDIHNYERQLDSTDTSSADSWFPAYYFMDGNGEKIGLDIGTTYELEVTYKVVDVAAGDNIGLQIGFGADGQWGLNRTRIKGYAVHKAEDEGKEFTYSTSYTAEKFNVGKDHFPKLLFSGQGKLEVLSIKIKKILPIIKDTVIGVQDYEDYDAGTKSGVLGNKKGIEVSKQANHTSGLFKNKSLKLDINTNYLRLSGNTIISLKRDGELKPFNVQKGAAYRITFYMYANENINDLTWSVNSVDSTLKGDYLTSFHMEVQDKVNLKKGEWKEIVAYIPVLKGCNSARNLICLAACSDKNSGKSVYIDDVKVEQLVDSEVLLYDTVGGEAMQPQRAFSGQRFLTFREPVKDGYLFDGWYYDDEYKTEARVSDKFPTGKSEITLYAKWIKAPTTAEDFTAGSFDGEIYDSGVIPYENAVADMDSSIEFENGKAMTSKTAWVKDAGIYGNGNSETDGALAFCNDFYSSYNDAFGYNVVRLVNEDGTPFTVVKGERYTLNFDYIFASHKGLSYIIPIISEHSAYADIGYDSYQTLGRVSVMETDTDYLSYKQSFIAERTGYVYIALTGRDDNANVDAHCYEKVYVDNLKIERNANVTKLVIKNGDKTWYTLYGVKGEKLKLANAVKEGTDTFDGFYLDKEFTSRFDGYFPENDTTIYVKLKKDKYDTPSNFNKPIVLDFEETDILEDFYRQSKYMTSWSREVESEWKLVTNDAKNALSGKNYIKLNGYSHYWNQAKFALYDPAHPENVMLLDKGGKYRVTVMVRCEDIYEAPVNMTICLENPAQRHLLAENGSVKLEYVPEGDKNGYYMFVGDIEVSRDMEYYPSLAIRRNANDLQSIFIDTVTVEKLRDCTVKYEENGGSKIDDAVVQIHDLVFDPGIPYKEGFVFDGWFTDSKFSKKWDFDNDTVEGDMTLYAKWSKEVIVEDKQEETQEDETVTDTVIEEVVENGEAPGLLDADAVVIEKNEDNVTQNTGMPLWAIILIGVGSLLVLAAVVFVIIVLIRKKKQA